MIRTLDAQLAAGKPVDLAPTCSLVGGLVTPFKWGLVPPFLFVVLSLLISKINLARNAKPKRD